MAYRLDVFDDFHLHGASAPEWQQRYLQMSGGTMRSALAEFSAGPVHVFRKWMSARVVQQGCLPAGQICFAAPLATGGAPARAQGRELAARHLLVLRGGEEFTLQRPPGMALLAVTFEQDAFERLLEARPWRAPARARLARSVLQVPEPALRAWRRALLGLFDAPPAEGAALRCFEALSRLVDDAEPAPQRIASASASDVVARCHALAAQHVDAPADLDALCRRLRISRRTLQASFRQVADTPPAVYLRNLRLDAVRRTLIATRADRLSVTQAALERGFTHLGRFAGQYKALFGQPPSQTVRAGALRSSA